MKPEWRIAEQAPADFFLAMNEIAPITVQLLWNRNIRDEKAAERFLHPDIQKDLHDPFLFCDMQKAVDRILRAVANKEKIAIWGDYDCDGVCGTAILFTLLRELGHQDHVNVHIPDRNKEGYGLTMEHLQELAELGIGLIITVDCGITDLHEVAWARERGIDVIIADHHSIPEKMPLAYAILNPKDPRSGYPFSGLAGTGVAYKLAVALLATHDKRQTTNDKKPIPENVVSHQLSVVSFLDLVCLATLADAMPLLDENRALVISGSHALLHTERLGLKALLKFCELEAGFSVRDIHFSLIPRINAMGRMEHASTSFRLLTTQDAEEADTLIRHIDEKNRERQLVVELICEEVLGRIASYGRMPEVVFEVSNEWMPGILGLAAQRVMNKVGRPVVLAVERTDEDKVMGNARALGSFNIVEVLHRRPELFIDSGGHPYAAGFSTTKANIGEVQELFLASGRMMQEGENTVLQNGIDIDAEFTLSHITRETYRHIRQLEPFGQENPEPKFLFKGLVLDQFRSVGKTGDHLKVRFSSQGSGDLQFVSGIGFGLGSLASGLQIGMRVDVVAKITENSWNGRTSLELDITAMDVVIS